MRSVPCQVDDVVTQAAHGPFRKRVENEVVGTTTTNVGIASVSADKPVGAVAAIEKVITVSTAELVGAAKARKFVGTIASTQGIALGRADKVLDAGERVALGSALGARCRW